MSHSLNALNYAYLIRLYKNNIISGLYFSCKRNENIGECKTCYAKYDIFENFKVS